MDIDRLLELSGITVLNEKPSEANIVFIPVSNMAAYEKWDHNKGLAQIYDDHGIHVHIRQETYFRQHVRNFEDTVRPDIENSQARG